MSINIKNAFRILIVAIIFGPGKLAYSVDASKPMPLATLPIKLVNNRVLVQVPVGHHTIKMALDTGASSTALFQSPEYDFTDLQIEGDANILFPALDEVIKGVRLAPLPLKFDGYVYTLKRPLRVDRRPPVADRLNARFDGVLGQDFFHDHVVEINRETKTIKLFAKSTDLSGRFRTTLPLVMKGSAPHVRLRSRLPWEKRIHAKELMLDTGYPGAMVIWGDEQFQQAAHGENPRALQDANKGIFANANFRIGHLRFVRTPVFIAPHEPRQAQKRDGLIGSNILIWFHHVIDFPNKRLLLDIGSVNFNRMDPARYVLNDETYLVKKFRMPPPASTVFVLDQQ